MSDRPADTAASPHEVAEIERRAAVVRPLLRSITPWPWKVAKVDEEGFPCVPHPHFDFYHEVTEVEVIESRPGYFHGRADCSKPPRCVNVGCYLGEEADADFIVSAPELVRQLRDDVLTVLSSLRAVEQEREAATQESDALIEAWTRTKQRVRAEALEEAARIAESFGGETWGGDPDGVEEGLIEASNRTAASIARGIRAAPPGAVPAGGESEPNWLGQVGLERLRLIEGAPVECHTGVDIAEVRLAELDWLCAIARRALSPGSATTTQETTGDAR